MDVVSSVSFKVAYVAADSVIMHSKLVCRLSFHCMKPWTSAGRQISTAHAGGAYQHRNRDTALSLPFTADLVSIELPEEVRCTFPGLFADFRYHGLPSAEELHC